MHLLGASGHLRFFNLCLFFVSSLSSSTAFSYYFSSSFLFLLQLFFDSSTLSSSTLPPSLPSDPSSLHLNDCPRSSSNPQHPRRSSIANDSLKQSLMGINCCLRSILRTHIHPSPMAACRHEFRLGSDWKMWITFFASCFMTVFVLRSRCRNNELVERTQKYSDFIPLEHSNRNASFSATIFKIEILCSFSDCHFCYLVGREFSVSSGRFNCIPVFAHGVRRRTRDICARDICAELRPLILDIIH